MCQHPRCGRKTYYLLEGTQYGNIQLCRTHGEQYHRNKGGTLKPFGRVPTDKEKTK